MSLESTYCDGRGSKFTIKLCGATVTSWMNCNEEILFCSKKAVRDGSKAIRGGIPLVFPNFGPWDLGPQHGFARIKHWKLTAESKTDEDPSWTFSLEDDEETRKMWNKKFRLDYTVQLLADALKTSLTVNNTGEESFSFTTLMHTYFRVKNINDTRIQGLHNLNYTDKVHGGRHTESRELVNIDENYDRIYEDCNNTVVLYPDYANQCNVTRELSTNNLPDIVVWNPWVEKAKGMSDFDDEEYLNMICVEAGAVTKPVTLATKECMSFAQTIQVGNRSKM